MSEVAELQPSVQNQLRSLLLPEEMIQLDAIREAISDRRRKLAEKDGYRGPVVGMMMALEDALSGASCIASGSHGLAPSNLEDAADRVRKIVISTIDS